jgi:DNA end-binding protein Ku
VAPRASWKGFLKLDEVTCAVALYTASSASERIAFHTINRETGHGVRRQFVDSVTDKPVESDAQVKGYEVGAGEFIVLDPEEIAAAVPESDKTLAVLGFVRDDEVDDVFLDRPYYLAPSDRSAGETFRALRDGMSQGKVAALARAVLFRRVRTLLIRPKGAGLVGTTLSFAYEVRSASEAFRTIPDLKISGEMLDLAQHIIKTKAGSFDPAQAEDHYEAALAALVKAKLEGKAIPPPKKVAAPKAGNLMEALRQSAGVGAEKPSRPARGKPAARPAAKAPAGRGAAKAAPARRKAS